MRFLGTHPGEANGPPWRANRKLFEAVRPSSERYASLRVRFSERALRWVKNLISKSEASLFKGLYFFETDLDPPKCSMSFGKYFLRIHQN